MSDEQKPKAAGLTKRETASLQQALDLLTEHFEMGVIMITFQRRNITRRHRMHFGNALAVQKLIDLFSAEELEVESPDPDVEDDEEDDGDGWKRQTVES